MNLGSAVGIFRVIGGIATVAIVLAQASSGYCDNPPAQPANLAVNPMFARLLPPPGWLAGHAAAWRDEHPAYRAPCQNSEVIDEIHYLNRVVGNAQAGLNLVDAKGGNPARALQAEHLIDDLHRDIIAADALTARLQALPACGVASPQPAVAVETPAPARPAPPPPPELPPIKPLAAVEAPAPARPAPAPPPELPPAKPLAAVEAPAPARPAPAPPPELPPAKPLAAVEAPAPARPAPTPPPPELPPAKPLAAVEAPAPARPAPPPPPPNVPPAKPTVAIEAPAPARPAPTPPPPDVPPTSVNPASPVISSTVPLPVTASPIMSSTAPLQVTAAPVPAPAAPKPAEPAPVAILRPTPSPPQRLVIQFDERSPGLTQAGIHAFKDAMDAVHAGKPVTIAIEGCDAKADFSNGSVCARRRASLTTLLAQNWVSDPQRLLADGR
jgi:hypothetical protein